MKRKKSEWHSYTRQITNMLFEYTTWRRKRQDASLFLAKCNFFLFVHECIWQVFVAYGSSHIMMRCAVNVYRQRGIFFLVMMCRAHVVASLLESINMCTDFWSNEREENEVKFFFCEIKYVHIYITCIICFIKKCKWKKVCEEASP